MGLTDDQRFNLMADAGIAANDYELAKQSLDELVYGTGAAISSVIAPDGTYSERATKALVRDVAEMYDYLHAYNQGHREASSKVSGSAESAMIVRYQGRLLKSMLYCLIRLVADSPWYDGTFAQLKQECRELLDSIASNTPKEEIWQFECWIDRGSPCTPGDLGGVPGTILENRFPLLKSSLAWPGDFLWSLDRIYEAFSGERIVDTIPARQRERIEKELEAGSERLGAGSQYAEKHSSSQVTLPVVQPDGEVEYVDVIATVNASRKRAYERWVRDFPGKDEWCRQYLAMRKAYFKLSDMNPLDLRRAAEGQGITDLEIEAVARIDVGTLLSAIDSMIEERGLAHITDGGCDVAYEKLKQAEAAIRHMIAKGQ